MGGIKQEQENPPSLGSAQQIPSGAWEQAVKEQLVLASSLVLGANQLRNST